MTSNDKSKIDLIDYVMKTANPKDIKSRAQIARIIDNVFDGIVDLSQNDTNLVITNFGTFTKTTRQGRDFTTPQGNIVHSDNKKVLVFKASRKNKERT